MNPTNPSSSPNPGSQNTWNNPSGATPQFGQNEPSKTEQFKETASQKTQEAKSAASSKAQDLKQKAAGAAEQAKQKVSEAAESLKHRATDAVDEKKENVASRIGGYSSALRDAGHSVEDEDPNIAWLSRQAADRLQGVADYIRHRDYQGLRADAESIARRHPAVLLGGMFFAGLLIGNAVRAGRNALQESETSPYGRYDEYDDDPELRSGEPMTSSSPAFPESSEI